MIGTFKQIGALNYTLIHKIWDPVDQSANTERCFRALYCSRCHQLCSEQCHFTCDVVPHSGWYYQLQRRNAAKDGLGSNRNPWLRIAFHSQNKAKMVLCTHPATVLSARIRNNIVRLKNKRPTWCHLLFYFTSSVLNTSNIQRTEVRTISN